MNTSSPQINSNAFDSNAWSTLQKLNTQLQSLVKNTRGAAMLTEAWEPDPWAPLHPLVFSDAVSKPIHAAVEALHEKLDSGRSDPNASYEEDVSGFANIVNDKVEHIRTLLENGLGFDRFDNGDPYAPH